MEGSIAPPPTAASIVASSERALNVLVVDDDPDVRDWLVTAVRLLGHVCRSAPNGREAWVSLQTSLADVVITDWLMPEMDGVELCRALRSRANGPYVYVVLASGLADREHLLGGMRAGADDYMTKPIDIDELQARLLAAARVTTLWRALEARNHRLRRDSRRLSIAARIDALTSVANRFALDEDLPHLIARARAGGTPVTAALCDVDLFKNVNDRHGHVAGDAVLRSVARAIRGCLRSGDLLYRYGGEEFLVVFPDVSLAAGRAAAARAREAVERDVRVPGENTAGDVTVSIGVAELDFRVDGTAEAWLRRADAALYRAKGNGRNRVEIAA